MNKTAKGMIVFGLCLICLGIIISLFNFNKIFNGFRNSGDEYSLKEVIITKEEINEILIDTKNEKVQIKPTQSSNIKITYYESKENYEYIIEEQNNTWSLKKEDKFRVIFFNFDFDWSNSGITIEIPKDLIASLDIKSSNGLIEVTDLEFKASKFTTSNGKIILENIKSDEDLTLKTSNANITLDNVSARNLDLKTSNGKLLLEGISANEITGDTSNGEINLNNITANNKMKMETSNGKIILEKIKSEFIDLKTSNGKVSGNILGNANEFKKDIKTSNGKIFVDGSEYGTRINDQISSNYILNIKSSNGSITIDFNS